MKKALVVLALALASVALVACGSSSNNSTSTSSTPSTPATGGGAATTGSSSAGQTSGASQTLKLEADPSGQLAYTTKTLSAKAGNVAIDFNNPQSIQHDVAVQDSSGKVVGTSDLIAQSSTTLDLKNLKPGTYTYFCTVPGHEQAGMKGTLTVK
jgi:plastocyanin